MFARIVHPRQRAIALVAALLCAVILAGSAGAPAVGEERFGRRKQMLALTNADRERHDRADLRFAARLSQYAKQHSEAMARRGYIFHSSEDELRRVLDGYQWSLGGENVGVGGSLERLQDAFMASQLHRKNILRRLFDHAAVGVFRDDDDHLWVTVIFYG